MSTASKGDIVLHAIAVAVSALCLTAMNVKTVWGLGPPTGIVLFTYLPSGRLLMVANPPRLSVFEPDSRQDQPRTLELRELQSAVITAAAASRSEEWVFAVGNAKEGEQGYVCRIDVRSGEIDSLVWLDEPFREPSLAVTDDDTVFISDRGSPTITRIDVNFFADRSWTDDGRGNDRRKPLSRRAFRRNVFLELGPASAIKALSFGHVLFVIHERFSEISIVDADSGEFSRAGDVSGGAESRTPSSVLVSRDRYGSGDVRVVLVSPVSGQVTAGALLSRDRVPGRLVIDRSVRVDGVGRLVSGAGDLSVIVSASEGARDAVILDGRLQRRGVVRLAGPVAALAVAPNGGSFMTASAGGDTQVYSLSEAEGVGKAASGSETVREAQGILIGLGYPVAVVDGYWGTSSQDAMAAFREAAGLRPKSLLDDEGMAALRAVGAERTIFDGRSAASLGSACEQLQEAARCTARTTGISADLGRAMIFCSSSIADGHAIQIDHLSRDGDWRFSYRCSTRHSCAFARFLVPIAYSKLCHGPRDEPARPPRGKSRRR